MHVDVVGLRREVVLIARETVADRDDGLAALLEARELARRSPAACSSPRPSARRGRARRALMRSSSRAARSASMTSRTSVSCSGVPCAFAIARSSASPRQLIDQRALRRDDERRGSRHEHALADHADEQQQEQAEQQDQVQQAAQPIEAAPDPRHDSHRPRAIVPIHVSLSCEGASDLSSINDNSGQKAMMMTAINETSRNGCVAQ